jgi:hypothetical protein
MPALAAFLSNPGNLRWFRPSISTLQLSIKNMDTFQRVACSAYIAMWNLPRISDLARRGRDAGCARIRRF